MSLDLIDVGKRTTTVAAIIVGFSSSTVLFSSLVTILDLRIPQYNLIVSLTISILLFWILKLHRGGVRLYISTSVLMLLAMAALLTSSIIKNEDQLKQEALKEMSELLSAIDRYASDTGQYPSQEDGLSVLVQSESKNWKGPYLQRDKLRDLWGQPYLYEYDGIRLKLTSSGEDMNFNTKFDIVVDKLPLSK